MPASGAVGGLLMAASTYHTLHPRATIASPRAYPLTLSALTSPRSSPAARRPRLGSKIRPSPPLGERVTSREFFHPSPPEGRGSHSPDYLYPSPPSGERAG